MEIKGKYTVTQTVDIDPKEVLSKLLKEALRPFIHSRPDVKYDRVVWSYYLENDKMCVKENFIRDGINYGHYDMEDRVVLSKDRTSDFSEPFLSYLKGLYLANNYYDQFNK